MMKEDPGASSSGKRKKNNENLYKKSKNMKKIDNRLGSFKDLKMPKEMNSQRTNPNLTAKHNWNFTAHILGSCLNLNNSQLLKNKLKAIQSKQDALNREVNKLNKAKKENFTVNELDVLNNRQQSRRYYNNFPLNYTFFRHLTLGNIKKRLKRKQDEEADYNKNKLNKNILNDATAIPGPSRELKRKKINNSTVSATPKVKVKKSIISNKEMELGKDLKPILDCLLHNTLNILDSKATLPGRDDEWCIYPNNRRIEDLVDTSCTTLSLPSASLPVNCKSAVPSRKKGQMNSIIPLPFNQEDSFTAIVLEIKPDKKQNYKVNSKSIENDLNYDADISSEESQSSYANPNLIPRNCSQNKVCTKLNKNKEVESASCEALYDPNSTIDMSNEEDFVLVPLLSEFSSVRNIPFLQMNAIDIEQLNNTNALVPVEAIYVPGNAEQNEDFPDWLLQMLGANITTEEENGHDEPNFYCQGDGLGVHPSVLANDVDDDNEDDTSSLTSTISSSLTSPTTHGLARSAETALENSELDVLSIPFDNTQCTEPENQRMVPEILNQAIENTESEEENSPRQILFSKISGANIMPNQSPFSNYNANNSNQILKNDQQNRITITNVSSEEYFDSNSKTS